MIKTIEEDKKEKKRKEAKFNRYRLKVERELENLLSSHNVFYKKHNRESYSRATTYKLINENKHDTFYISLALMVKNYPNHTLKDRGAPNYSMLTIDYMGNPGINTNNLSYNDIEKLLKNINGKYIYINIQ